MPPTRTRKAAAPAPAATSSPSPVAPARPSAAHYPPELRQKIATTAYHLWEKRGRPAGTHLQDWVEAEKIVLGARDK